MRHQQEATRGGAGDQSCGLCAGIEGAPERDGQDRAQCGDLVGNDAILEIDQRGGQDEQDQNNTQGYPRS